MQVVPQQQVQEDGLTVGVVTQSRRTQTSVEETEGSDTHTHTQNKLNRFVVNEQVQTSDHCQDLEDVRCVSSVLYLRMESNWLRNSYTRAW